MSDYVPTLDRVRSHYVEGRRHATSYQHSPSAHLAEFDRWLADHDAQVRAAAYEEARQGIAEALAKFIPLEPWIITKAAREWKPGDQRG